MSSIFSTVMGLETVIVGDVDLPASLHYQKGMNYFSY
jgi:hypothetical protein